jgi:hypothetical protein
VPATLDRSDVIHFAGRHRLSPALRDGEPVLVGQGEPGARCGWADFFAALEARGLALAFDPDDGSSARLVPAAEAARTGHGPGPLEEIRRFVTALRGARRGSSR